VREEDGGSADPQKLAMLEGIQRSVLVSVPAFLRDLEGCPMTSIYCVNHTGTTMALPGGMEAREGYRGVTAANGSLAPGKHDLCLRSLRSKVHLRYSRRMSPLNTHDREAWFEGPSARCEVTLAGVQAKGRRPICSPKDCEPVIFLRFSTGDVFRAAMEGSECEQSPRP
jgi:hypothetical protein